jgi:hypothetical protein
VFLFEVSDHVEEMVELGDSLGARAAPAVAFLPVAHLLGDHLESEAMEELFFDHL